MQPSLTDDINQLILCFLPDYTSLGSAMLVCKAFYGVWRSYPIQYELASASRTEVILKNGDHAEDMTFLVQKRLMKVAGNVRSLRGIFAAHYKNGRPLKSIETHRFDRAMYHLMLYGKKFGFNSIPDDDEHCEEWDNSTIQEKLDLEELRELTAVVRFIMDLADVTFEYNFSDLDILMGTHYTQFLLACGPVLCLLCYTQKNLGSVIHNVWKMYQLGGDWLYRDFIMDIVRQIAKGRGAEPDEISYWHTILEAGPDIRRDPPTALREFDDFMLEPAPCRDGAVYRC
ncbi:hypothetical protein GGG16DRAFT_118004 [Schizophyllum commune]